MPDTGCWIQITVESFNNSQERFDRPEGRGNGDPGAAFEALPVIVGQQGAGCKKIFVSRLARTVQRPKRFVDFHSGQVQIVAPGIQEIPAVPACPVVGLENRQIEDRLRDTFSIRMQPSADKPAACQDNSPASYGVLGIVQADIHFKTRIRPVPDRHNPPL